MITVEIWSDVVCPWCYIGKRRFERAVAAFETPVDVVWRSFQLDPDAPAHDERGLVESLAARKGMGVEAVRSMFAHVTELAAGEGLAYDFDRVKTGNTFTAHRLLHFAAAHDRRGELKERLLHAYFTEGEPVGDPQTLARLAADVGLDRARAEQVLDSDAYAAEVREDFATARAFGITGVPFFVFDRRLAVSGAQPVEVFTRALGAARDASDAGVPDAGGQACEGDSCAV
jgi:predicted DsbA family dithiol-disulfide isomerase